MPQIHGDSDSVRTLRAAAECLRDAFAADGFAVAVAELLDAEADHWGHTYLTHKKWGDATAAAARADFNARRALKIARAYLAPEETAR